MGGGWWGCGGGDGSRGGVGSGGCGGLISELKPNHNKV